MLNVDHIVTGHNADDIAETVLMNSMCFKQGTFDFKNNLHLTLIHIFNIFIALNVKYIFNLFK